MNITKRARDYYFISCNLCGICTDEAITPEQAREHAINAAWWKQPTTDFTICLKCRQHIATGL